MVSDIPDGDGNVANLFLRCKWGIEKSREMRDKSNTMPSQLCLGCTHDSFSRHSRTNIICTVILFSSRYLFPAKSICPTCKQAIQIFMQIRAAASPLESFVLFLTKFVPLGKKYIWPEPDLRIYIGPMGRDHSHRDCGHDSSTSSGRVWQLDMV